MYIIGKSPKFYLYIYTIIFMYTINDLPSYSKWPLRLLGLENFTELKKNNSEIEREFGIDKWGALLKEIESGNVKTLEEADDYGNSDVDTLIFNNGQFELSSLKAATLLYNNLVFDICSKYFPSKSIVELGCGYGSVILNIAQKMNNKEFDFFAADLTTSGSLCAQRLAQMENIQLKTGWCDFNNPDVTNLNIPQNSIIFTSYALHYIKGIPQDFINFILSTKPKAVIHFEPLAELFDNSLYGLMKRKYMQVNDYNMSMLSTLKEYEKKGTLKIRDVVPEVFGKNPLLPASIIVWEGK